jgi:hypothetical protein
MEEDTNVNTEKQASPEVHLDHAKIISRWNMVMAALLFISPFVFSFAGTTSTAIDDYLIAAVVFILAGIRQYTIRRNIWLSWVNAVLGLWLIVSPFILGFTSLLAIWTNIILGIVIGVLAIASAAETRRTVQAAR